MHAVGIIAASALLALTFLGGEMLQIAMGVPRAVTALIQGLLLFYLLICDAFIQYRLRWRPSALAPAFNRKPGHSLAQEA
jgi:simple sugar transport system permease protein